MALSLYKAGFPCFTESKFRQSIFFLIYSGTCRPWMSNTKSILLAARYGSLNNFRKIPLVWLLVFSHIPLNKFTLTKVRNFRLSTKNVFYWCTTSLNTRHFRQRNCHILFLVANKMMKNIVLHIQYWTSSGRKNYHDAITKNCLLLHNFILIIVVFYYHKRIENSCFEHGYRQH